MEESTNHRPGTSAAKHDWSSLTDVLLHNIFKRLIHRRDKKVVRCVCVNWSSPHLHSPPTPWLTLPSHQDYIGSFFRLIVDDVHHMDLPEVQNKYCCGSSEGYLILRDLGEEETNSSNSSITLLDPITKSLFELPSFHPYGSNIFTKVVLSSNPTPSNYIAMAIFGAGRHPKTLAICRSGDKGWTLISFRKICDIVYYDGQFYALNNNADLFIISNSLIPRPRLITRSVHQFPPVCAKYLVELSGELMLAIRLSAWVAKPVHQLCKTEQFELYKLDRSCKKWVRMYGVGDFTLFVGSNCSVSALASESPHCRANCIYFKDEQFANCRDFGIFNLHTRRVEPFPSSCPLQHLSFWPPFTWITPSLLNTVRRRGRSVKNSKDAQKRHPNKLCRIKVRSMKTTIA